MTKEICVEEEKVIDPLDQAAVLDLAFQHGNAQHVYQIVNEDELYSKFLSSNKL